MENVKKEENVFGKLATKVCEILKIGDDGKINSFFTRQTSALNRNLVKAKRNVETIEIQHNDSIIDFEEKIKDAEDAIENALVDIDPKSLGNNADSDRFADKYWSKIDLLESKLEEIKEDYKESNKSWENRIESAKKVVKHLEKRLAQIA